MKVKCDLVRCINNKYGVCQADLIELTLNHYDDSNGKDHQEFIECANFEEKKVKNKDF